MTKYGRMRESEPLKKVQNRATRREEQWPRWQKQLLLANVLYNWGEFFVVVSLMNSFWVLWTITKYWWQGSCKSCVGMRKPGQDPKLCSRKIPQLQQEFFGCRNDTKQIVTFWKRNCYICQGEAASNRRRSSW